MGLMLSSRGQIQLRGLQQLHLLKLRPRQATRMVYGCWAQRSLSDSRLWVVTRGAPAATADATSGPAPIEFSVTFVKGANDRVGLDADWGDMVKLKITKIKDGIVDKWNQDNP